MVSFKLRFKEFISEKYETFLLGEICNIERGRKINKNYIKENMGIYPVISSNTWNNGIFGYINAWNYDGEYITVTASGFYTGTFFYQNQKFSATSDCLVITLKNNIFLKKYLYYFLKINEKKYSQKLFAAVPIRHLTSQELFKHKVILPNILEQNKIVDFLNLLDKKNELNNLILNNHLILKKVLISLLFI